MPLKHMTVFLQGRWASLAVWGRDASLLGAQGGCHMQIFSSKGGCFMVTVRAGARLGRYDASEAEDPSVSTSILWPPPGPLDADGVLR